MFRGKEHYDKPETALARLELESPICSGSVDMNASSPNGVSVEAQEVNTGFGGNNNFTDSSWDKETQN